MIFNAFLVGDGLVPSRAEFVEALNTVRDKPVPYEEKAATTIGLDDPSM